MKAEEQRAGFVMSLKALNAKIVFSPTFVDVEAAVVETYDVMVKASFEVVRFEHVLEQGEQEVLYNRAPSS